MKTLLTIFTFSILLFPKSNFAQAGCTDPGAHNYDPTATVSDGSCETCFDGVKNGDEFQIDCGGVNPNCPPCTLQEQLNVEGNAKIRGFIEMGGNETNEVIAKYFHPEGFNQRYDLNFFTAHGDCLVFEKTDQNNNDPDGCISFVNTGVDGVQEVAMTIRGNNNIGIGTNFPSTALHIASIQDAGPNNHGALILGSAITDVNLVLDNNEIIARNNGIGSRLTLNGINDNTADVVITSRTGGQVGIGVSPSYKLTLPNDSANEVGQVIAYDFDTYSDARVKSNFQPVEQGIKTIMLLNPVHYRHHSSMHNDEKVLKINQHKYQNETGFIAQEVYEVLPDIVHKPEREEEELWSMSYSKLIPYLTKAIQEQQMNINRLEAEVKKLKSKF